MVASGPEQIAAVQNCVYFLSSSFDLNICLREFQTESKTVFAVKAGIPHVACVPNPAFLLHSRHPQSQ